MKKKNKLQQTFEEIANQDISRKEAIKKAGYIAASAAGMMLLLGKPQKALASSPAAPPAW